MASGKSIAFAPVDLLYANHSTPRYTPGHTFFIDPTNGRVYLYVKATTGGTHANTLIGGRPVYWDVRNSGTTKSDIGGTEKTFAGVIPGIADSAVAGGFINPATGLSYGAVAIASIPVIVTSGNYTWIQVEGDAWVYITSALTINSQLIPDDANGLLKIEGAAATDVVCGTNKKAGGDSTATPAVATLCNIRGWT